MVGNKHVSFFFLFYSSYFYQIQYARYNALATYIGYISFSSIGIKCIDNDPWFIGNAKDNMFFTSIYSNYFLIAIVLHLLDYFLWMKLTIFNILNRPKTYINPKIFIGKLVQIWSLSDFSKPWGKWYEFCSWYLQL